MNAGAATRRKGGGGGRQEKRGVEVFPRRDPGDGPQGIKQEGAPRPHHNPEHPLRRTYRWFAERG